LKVGQTSDLVRILTISDMFAALIERRAYESIMSCRAAYSGLLKMGARLDPDLRREFQFVAGLQVG
jgi:HD-GYP domain-containing protein (c-di-GMP phosphodiesterase class II)